MFKDQKIYTTVGMTKSDWNEFNDYIQNEVTNSNVTKKSIDEHFNDWGKFKKIQALRDVRFP
jgi:hypothetical protein